jgi:hypothetical protein
MLDMARKAVGKVRGFLATPTTRDENLASRSFISSR